MRGMITLYYLQRLEGVERVERLVFMRLIMGH